MLVQRPQKVCCANMALDVRQRQTRSFTHNLAQCKRHVLTSGCKALFWGKDKNTEVLIRLHLHLRPVLDREWGLRADIDMISRSCISRTRGRVGCPASDRCRANPGLGQSVKDFGHPCSGFFRDLLPRAGLRSS